MPASGNGSNGENGSRTIIRKIITRYPNLECGFFAALMTSHYIRRMLGITRGNITWEFQSTAAPTCEGHEPDVVYFNTGGTDWDQHGHPYNQDKSLLEQVCSLDLVRVTYDFLMPRFWLWAVYDLVRKNDLSGERISTHKQNLREIMNGLTIKYRHDPTLVLTWLSLAFRGIFEQCRAGADVKDVFNPDQLSAGVAIIYPDYLDWFNQTMQEGIDTIEEQWGMARDAVRQAENIGAHEMVAHPDIPVGVRVMAVHSDSVKTAPAARQHHAHVIVQVNSTGNIQIHGGRVFEYADRKKRDRVIAKYAIDMGPIAHALRLEEARVRGKRIKPKQDWTSTGMIEFDDETRVPWYLPEFRTSVYNGTLSSTDVEPTQIPLEQIRQILLLMLPQCKVSVEQVIPVDAELAAATE